MPDVATAFPSVARGCLLRKMRDRGLDKCLIRWTDCFMRDRRVVMSVDGQDSRGISFVDDITWVVEGTDLTDVVSASKLERCADASLRWADSSAVRFETPKTEAILFSRQRKHRRCGRGSEWRSRWSTSPVRPPDG